jgi:hypothetical protein
MPSLHAKKDVVLLIGGIPNGLICPVNGFKSAHVCDPPPNRRTTANVGLFLGLALLKLARLPSPPLPRAPPFPFTVVCEIANLAVRCGAYVSALVAYGNFGGSRSTDGQARLLSR